MSRETITYIRDDLDGSEDAEAVQFTWEGTTYSIDLGADNQKKITEFLAPFIDVAKIVEQGVAKRAVKPVKRYTPELPPYHQDYVDRNGLSKSQRRVCREWFAEQTGITPPAQGVIPNMIATAFLADDASLLDPTGPWLRKKEDQPKEDAA